MGYPSFPVGFAQVQRQLLLAKAVAMAGFGVTVLCRYGIHKQGDGVSPKGIFEDINYVYCSGTSLKPDGYVRRNLLKFKGLFHEVKYIARISKTRQLAGLLISTNSFHNILIYFFTAKIIGIPITIDNVEYWTSIKVFKGWIRIEKYLYDKFYFFFADNIICISDYLVTKVGISKKDKVFKIPAITDFDKFINHRNRPRKIIRQKYFLYCGSDFYSEVINFIIASFEKVNYNDIILVLVTKSTEKLINRIKSSKKNHLIKVLTNLPYQDLVNLYLNCEALILPMRNTIQDKARFPHKISEYCASKRPIITNNVGEIRNYFNNANAYLCTDYDEQEYANAMLKIISDPEKATGIGWNGYETGIVHFNYKSYSTLLGNLFDKK